MTDDDVDRNRGIPLCLKNPIKKVNNNMSQLLSEFLCAIEYAKFM